jgi:uncharacterized protein YjbI with pentapeptide repeats
MNQIDYTPEQWIYENALITRFDVSNQELDPVELYECEIRGARLNGVTLRRWVFENCLSKDSDLSTLILKQCVFQNCRFEGCKLIGSDWRQNQSLLLQVRFYACDLSLSWMSDLHFDQWVVDECQCTEVDFSRSQLLKSKWIKTNVSGALFEESQLQESDLVGALHEGFHPDVSNLKGATLSIETAIRLIEEQGMFVSKECSSYK